MPTPSRRYSVLVVDDENYLLPTLSDLLSSNFNVFTADSAESAKQVFSQHPIDIILTDQKMPRITGVQLLEWVRRHSPRTVRLLMVGYAELEEATEAIRRGVAYHYLLKPWRIEQLLQILRNAADKFLLERSRGQLLEELKHFNQELEKRVAERTREVEETNHLLQQRTRELEMLALTDPLTGLLNRRAIDDAARAEVKRHQRYRNPLALGLIDVDHFREINKRYLIPGGDHVLIALAKTLNNSVRNVDTVGRIGGDEFLVLAPETNLEGAQLLAERIRTTVENTRFSYQDEPIHVTVSLGFVVGDVTMNTDYDEIKHVAAAALAEAKARGRNCTVVRPVLPGVHWPRARQAKLGIYPSPRLPQEPAPPVVHRSIRTIPEQVPAPQIEPTRPPTPRGTRPVNSLVLLEALKGAVCIVPLCILLGAILHPSPDSNIPAWFGALVGLTLGAFLGVEISKPRWRILEYLFESGEEEPKE